MSTPLQTEQLILRRGLAEHCLPEGLWVIGRAADCTIVIDDPLASRRHARIRVGGNKMLIENLSSTNGLQVNGANVTSARTLAPGDTILIGATQLIVASGTSRRGAKLPPIEVEPRGRSERARSATLRPQDTEEPTRKTDSLHLLGALADKGIAQGYPEQAERILSPILEECLSRALLGRRLDDEQAEHVALQAVKLAKATKKSDWLEYVFALYGAQRVWLPSSLLDGLHAAFFALNLVNSPAVKKYLDRMPEPRTAHEKMTHFRIQALL